MAASAKAAAQLERLRALAADPPEQARYALELLQPGARLDVVQAALAALRGRADPEARAGLWRQYAYYAAEGVRRDPGTSIRVAILNILRALAVQVDGPLLEAAAGVYEFLPPARAEAATGLRAAALVILNDLDPPLAAFHAVRLLGDRYTSSMSGEPAVTAALILAAQGQVLPLYYYVCQSRPAVSEVVSECLRNLGELPAALLPSLVAQFETSEDEVVLAGLFDLLLTHPAGAAHHHLIRSFLRTTYRYDVYRYVVTTLVASHKQDWLDDLLALAREERNPQKAGHLREALALVPGDPRVVAALARLDRA